MRRVLPLAVLLTFFISTISFSQITIKEKVGIRPETYFNLSSAPPPNNIILNIHWDNPKVSVWVIGSVIPCKDVSSTPSENDGNLTFEIENAQPGTYWFFVEVGGVEFELVNLTYQILLNGTQVKSDSTFLITKFSYTGDWTGFWVDYTPGLISDYSLNLGYNLCYETELSPVISTSKNCATGFAWNPSKPISLSLVEGSEYVSFYYRINGQCYDTFESRGDNLTVSKSELDNHIVFKQDVMFEGEESKVVKIQANWAGVIRTDSVIIYPKKRYLIKANIEEGKDSIYNGNQVKMILTGITDVSRGYCTPIELTYNAEIIKGGKYGNLFNYDTGERGQNLTGLDQFTLGPCQPCGMSNLGYIADGVEPEKKDSIVIRFSTSDPQIPPTDTVLIIKPPPIKITIIPATIAAGDTAKIIIQKRNLDGIVEDCPPEQPFEIGMVDGCMLGSILASSPLEEDSGAYFIDTYFWGVNQTNPIYFIADSSADSGLFKIRAGLIENWESWVYAKKITVPDTAANEETKSKKLVIKQLNNKSINMLLKKVEANNKTNNANIPFNTQSSICFDWEFDSKFTTDAGAKIEDESSNILLGETKYYQAKYDSLSNKLVIEEVKPGSDGVPKLNGGLASDIWGKNPVSVDTGKNYGKRMGVYWETEKPVWDGNTNKGILKKGLIRLIGRYWSKDSTYIVRLKAKNNNDSSSIKIKVKEPYKLLSKDQSPEYNKAIDVHNSSFGIDSICIYYGGKYGIPPQMLKGQMLTESATKNFGSNIGTGFAPSYRYEAYTTQFWNILKDIVKTNTNPFIVTKTAMGKQGAGSVPTTTEHKHVLYYHYFESPQTVWDIVEANSSLVDVDNKTTTYGFQYKGTGSDTLRKGQIKSGVYSIVDNNYLDYLMWKNINKGNRSGGYEKIIKEKYKIDKNDILSREQQIEANDSARIAAINFLENNYEGGLKNSIAQTRISSSYGLLQSLYTTVLKEHKYPTTNADRPENLNEVKISMDYAIKHLKKLFNNFNGFTLETHNNWVSNYAGQLNTDYPIFPKPIAGFEQALAVMYYKWNPGLKDRTYAVYHKKVLINSKKFLPRSK
ncbi:MAG: hypothetical protein WBV81_09760 [Ignavibacteriaceae bacterium]